MQWLLLVLSLSLNASGNVIAKYAMKEAPANANFSSLILFTVTNWKVLLSMACFSVAFGGYAMVLTKMDLSLAYPIMTTGGFLIILVASFFLFSEHISVMRIIGFLIVIVGIWLISRS